MNNPLKFLSVGAVVLAGLIPATHQAHAQTASTDFVWRHSAYGYDALWIMNDIYAVNTPPLTPDPVSDLNWKIVGTGNFNGDTSNKPDLLWWHQTTGQLVVWFMDGQNTISTTPLNPAQASD